jgi:hypothetical protein
MEQQDTLEQLTYEWPPNLTQYEARLFLGLSAIEAISGGLAFILPVALLPSVLGFVVGLFGAVVVILSIKRLEALGNLALPTYLVARFLTERQPVVVELPLILGESSGGVLVESWEGESLLVWEA